MSPERRSVPASLDQAAALSWRFLVVTAALAVLAWILLRLLVVVMPIIAALFLASWLVPASTWLKRRRWPPAAAAGTVLLGSLLVLAGLVAVVVPQLTAGAPEMVSSVLEAVDAVQRWLAAGPFGIPAQEIDRYVELVLAQVRENASQIAGGVLGGAVLAVEIVAGLVLAFVILFFFLKDGDRMVDWGLGLLDGEGREEARVLGRRAWRTMSSYLRGVAVIATVDAVLIGIGLAVIGVPLALPLAVLVFFGGFLPLVGAFLSGLVAVLVALVSAGLGQALLAAGVVIGVQQLEGHVLAPLVLGRAMELHPLVVVVALTAGAVVAGVIGAFLAVPITAVAAAVGAELRSRRAVRAAGEEAPGEP